MAASATFTIPLTAATPAQRSDVTTILGSLPGSEALVLASDGSSATFKLQMPGNLDAFVAKLRKRGLMRTGSVDVSFPVKAVVDGAPVLATTILAALSASPAVVSARFDGSTVSATILPATSSMRYMYEELLHHNLVPIDHPTRAGKDDYIL